DAAGALDDAIAYDRNCSLAHDHVAALRRGNPARRWLVGALRHLAAWTTECSRGDGLALARIGARPYRVVHALECDRPAAGIADRGADLDVQLLCFCQGAPKDAIGFFQGETHRLFPPPGTLMFPRRRDYSAARHRAPLPVRLNRAGRERNRILTCSSTTKGKKGKSACLIWWTWRSRRG